MKSKKDKNININNELSEKVSNLEVKENENKVCESEIFDNKQIIDKISLESTVLTSVENGGKVRKKRKKLKRKISDPAVKNVTELMSSNLNIISPNTSLDVNTNDEVKSPKANVFKFMMDNRNKSIGRNSPGKDNVEDPVESEENLNARKAKLLARRNLLEGWAEIKGAAKRKREEEEKEICINYKLKKRAKRLKKLLKAEELTDNSIIVEEKKKHKHKIKPEHVKESLNNSINEFEEFFETNRKSSGSEKKMNGRKSSTSPKTQSSNLLSFLGKSPELTKDIEDNKNVKIFSEKSLNSKKKQNNCDSIQGKQKRGRPRKSELIYVEDSGQDSVVSVPVDDSSTFSTSPKSSSNLLSFLGKSPELIKDVEDTKIYSKKSLNFKKKQNDCDLLDVTPKRGRPKKSELISVEDSSMDSVVSVPIDSGNKMSLRTRKPKVSVTLPDSEDDDSDTKRKKGKLKKAVKVAPVFLKATTTKPILDPEVVEARKQFLFSGMPSSLKKVIEKEKIMEEREYDVFPTISHIQQRNENSYWNLSNVNLQLNSISPLKIEGTTLIWNNLNDNLIETKLESNNFNRNCTKITKFRQILKQIKIENPNYPVYKCFRQIYEKRNNTKPLDIIEKIIPKKRRSKRKSSEIKLTLENDWKMWTDKYKPTSSDDIIGNSNSVCKLKKWLTTWLEFSEDVKNVKKRKHYDSTSESEFYLTDGDSLDSCKMPSNTIILQGPTGSGKTSAVYAVCNEMGINVLEMNASSKRTGKRLLQKLQEATQSHQVRKDENNPLKSFISSSKSIEESSQKNKKMCVLLVEDIDLVFDQDDGFITALSTLIQSSKRPIILTTTDETSIHVQKFSVQFKTVKFSRLSSRMLSTWLQLVCLVEGEFVKLKTVADLLDYYRGDVRKTMLQLQYWLQSGGDFDRCAEIKDTSIGEEDASYLFEEGSVKVHQNFGGSKRNNRFDLGVLWWNFPQLLSVPDFSSCRLLKSELKICGSVKEDKNSLEMIGKLYDSVVLIDAFEKRTMKGYFNEFERWWSTGGCLVERDGLSLNEIKEDYNGCNEFFQDLGRVAVKGSLQLCNQSEFREENLDWTVPASEERSWRNKITSFSNKFEAIVTPSSLVERKSLHLDYFPSLRNMVRSENQRALTNTKRGNRFRHYLKTELGLNCDETTLNFASSLMTYGR